MEKNILICCVYTHKACSLSKMKEIQEKDAEIERLKAEIMIAVNSLKEINRHLSNEEHVDSSWIKGEIELNASAYVKNLEFKSRYLEVVKDIKYLTFKIKGHLTLDSLEKLNDKIRTKYGLNKKEG